CGARQEASRARTINPGADLRLFGDRRAQTSRPFSSIGSLRKMFFAINWWQRKLAGYAPLPLRVIVGCVFRGHAYAKRMRAPDVFGAIVHAMAVRERFFMAWLTILVELLGGFAV